MENNKDIGKAFKDKLADLDKSPSDALWNAIEKDLDKKKKKRAIFWVFPSLILLGLLSSALYFNSFFDGNKGKNNPKLENIKTITTEKINSSNTTNSGKIDSENNSITNHSDSSKNKSISFEKNSDLNNANSEKNDNLNNKNIKNSVSHQKRQVSKLNYYTSLNPKKKSNIYKKKSSKKVKNSENNITSNNLSNHAQNSENTSLDAKIDENNSFNSIEKNKLNSIIEKGIDSLTIAKTNTKKKAKENPKKEEKKDSIPTEQEIERSYFGSFFYGPTVFNTFSNESLLNSGFNNLAKSSPITSTYGFYLKSKYKRYGISVGVSKINLQLANPLDKNTLIPSYTSILLNGNTTTASINTQFGNSNQVKLIQELSYYQLSFEFYYSLLQNKHKYDIEGFGGVSTMTLGKNALYLSSENIKKQEIGSVDNVLKANVSLDLGLGINYQLAEKFQLDFNPIFKLYFVPISQNSSPKPYSFSIQSGISYKF